MMASSNGNISALLALCAGNSPVTGEFPSQRPVTQSFDVFFDICLNKRLSKQSWDWWFEMPSRSLWSHCNVTHDNVMACKCFFTLLMFSMRDSPDNNGFPAQKGILVCFDYISGVILSKLLNQQSIWDDMTLVWRFWYGWLWNIQHMFVLLSDIYRLLPLMLWRQTLTARFMVPTWGPSGADRTQVGSMLAPWTLLSGNTVYTYPIEHFASLLLFCGPVIKFYISFVSKLRNHLCNCIFFHLNWKEMLLKEN